MAAPEGVTVALPIYRADPARLGAAFGSITGQTLKDLEILVVPNGADAATLRLVRDLARQDRRSKVITLPKPGLAAALNAAIEKARFPLVARMDADDTCPPERLERQAGFMLGSPEIAALGTASEFIDVGGHVLGVERPFTEPAEIRWRLCLRNIFCHGSMMVRREAVLGVGGYDPACRFAQDYDLWLRLSRGHALANLPDVLYRYTARTWQRHEEQDRIAAAVQVRHWSMLPAPDAGRAERIAALLAASAPGGSRAREALAEIESLLCSVGPSREALLAWQIVGQRAGALGDRREELVRAAGERLRAAGVGSVWCYGAGRQTAWLLENPGALGVAIAGVIDDHAAGSERFGYQILAPADLPANAEVLLSSEAHEDALWDASLPLRAAGARVWRVFGAAQPDPLAAVIADSG